MEETTAETLGAQTEVVEGEIEAVAVDKKAF